MLNKLCFLIPECSHLYIQELYLDDKELRLDAWEKETQNDEVLNFWKLSVRINQAVIIWLIMREEVLVKMCK